jgi:hypothetical protein
VQLAITALCGAIPAGELHDGTDVLQLQLGKLPETPGLKISGHDVTGSPLLPPSSWGNRNDSASFSRLIGSLGVTIVASRTPKTASTERSGLSAGFDDTN